MLANLRHTLGNGARCHVGAVFKGAVGNFGYRHLLAVHLDGLGNGVVALGRQRVGTPEDDVAVVGDGNLVAVHLNGLLAANMHKPVPSVGSPVGGGSAVGHHESAGFEVHAVEHVAADADRTVLTDVQLRQQSAPVEGAVNHRGDALRQCERAAGLGRHGHQRLEVGRVERTVGHGIGRGACQHLNRLQPRAAGEGIGADCCHTLGNGEPRYC